MLRNIPIAMMRTFEAAARTGSFRAAADELFLSPSAVSHAIRRLEDQLGTSLFKRSTRTIVLTPAGETLYSHVGRAFDELRQGIDLVSSDRPAVLRMHSAPSFAAQWLLPRLRRFLETHPQIDLRLAANTEYARFEYNEFDLDVVYGKPRSEGQLVVPLAEELLTPLCSKEMAAQIRTVEDLYRVPLIQSDVKQIRWPAWFEHHGMPSPPLKGARFDRSFLAIAAAADGLGVALESTLLAERELARGDLVRPLAGIEQEMYYTGHYLTYSHATRRLQAIGEFREWMMAELGMPSSCSAVPT
ncbi:MAG: LysR substrate-binding domain-containing protein [Alcaligenes nematophilus]|uniref:LysR substrate-binding domain-containing protein n=1 Tax=Alcaligenes TaxID=507 RepID=UPI001CF6C4DF|nr:LysR substrate-binding domain-containing protein [Alcaligenes sp. 13f]MCB4320681.1 LysR family transcriptional regulator [Alcaligenes sp. 13f]